MTKQILIVVDSIDENDSSGSKANVAVIKNLNRSGFKLKVLHYTRGNEFDIEGVCCVGIPEIKYSFNYFLSRIQRVLTRITRFNINNQVENLIGFSFTFLNDVYSFTKKLKKENVNDYDWVLTLSYASSFRPHRALLNLPNWHEKWLAYVHDPYPMHSYPRPYDWVEPGHKFKRKFFLEICNNAFKLIYPSKLLADWMSSYYHPQKDKILIIPHQISSLYKTKKELPKFIDINKFNILHAGSLMSARKPYALVEAYKLFLEEVPESKEISNLIFIGKQDFFMNYFEREMFNLPQLIVRNYLPFDEVINIQSNVSLNVIIEAKGPISPFLPGKFPHLIAAEKPILLLGPIYSESKRVLGESFENWSEIDDVELIKEKLIKCFEDWKQNSFKVSYKSQIDYLSQDNLKYQIESISK